MWSMSALVIVAGLSTATFMTPTPDASTIAIVAESRAASSQARGGGPQRPPRDGSAAPAAPAGPVIGTGAIHGRVVDAITGQPLSKVRLRVNRRDMKTVLTGVDGTFGFSGLPAGPLSVWAERSTYMPMLYPEQRRTLRSGPLTLAEGQTIGGVTIAMHRMGAISGRVIDQNGDPVEGVSVQVVRAPARGRSTGWRAVTRGQPSNDIGEFRIARLEPGTYALLAAPVRRGEPDDTGLGRVYFPGVASLDQAQLITIEKGQSVTGLDFPVSEIPLTRLTGFVVGSSGGRASSGMIQARVKSADGGFLNVDGGAQIRPDGSFEMRLQPGEYVLEAMMMNRPPMGSPSPADSERGLLSLAVGGDVMSGVTVTAGHGSRVTGRIVFEGRRPPPDLRQVTLNFQPKEGAVSMCQPVGRPQINPDGTFVYEGLWGGCELRAGSPAGWQLKSVLHRDTDITGRLISFESGQQVNDLQVTFTDRIADLTLDVTDDRGTPLTEYVAIVFPTNKNLWGDIRYSKTYVASTTLSTGSNGAPPAQPQGFMTGLQPPGALSGGPMGAQSQPTMPFGQAPSQDPRVSGLLPGEYFAVVVDDVMHDDLRDPAYLAQLVPLSTQVTLADGDTKPVQLRRVALIADAR